MAIVTATPPDSETEVIVAVHEDSSTVDESSSAAVIESAVPEASEDNEGQQCGETVSVSHNDTAEIFAEPVQKLYRHDCEYGCCATRWSKYAVAQEEQDDLEAEVRKTQIVQRYAYNAGKAWETSSFTINCPYMREFLSEALAKYQDLDLDLDGWAFAPPYKPLVHRWDRLQTLHRELNDSTGHDYKKEAVNQLVNLLQPILVQSIEDLASTRDTGKVHYDMMWQIFPPGETVITKFWGIDTVCRVVKYHKSVSRGSWFITVEYVDWDGEKCGFQTTEVQIKRSKYSGFTRVSSLPVYPLSFSDNPDAIKESMEARGRRFQELRGYHFLSYRGVKLSMSAEWEQEPVTGRVIIDTYAYYHSNNIVKPELSPLDGGDSENAAKAEENGETEDEDRPEESEEDDAQDDECSQAASDESYDSNVQATLSNQDEATRRVQDLTELPDDLCILTTPWLVGFDLKKKQWGRFVIDNLNEIVWNEKAFDNLVLPGGEKELAWEFVESKARSEETIDDFVPEKGRGIIILMFGPPGVGKTYTAEAVAEKARVPLYLVSAGMLGTSPEVVEPALTHALELCRLWNAMLLLDEADVFLSARLDDSLARNELVSIFLTKLEYYQGILFLTTNRFSRIDYAFQSRVDLFLPYNDLDSSARKLVWNNFLEHFGPDRFDVSADNLDRLSELPLNGREIKNLLKSALLLNTRREGKVTADRLHMLADKRVAALKMLKDHNAAVKC